ncbi:DUF1998 domain-containing protein, partial [Thermomonas sp.]
HALHVVARIAVMADGADLRKAVGSGDGAWSASGDGHGRGQLRATDGAPLPAGALARFQPTVYLYDNYPGGVGLSEPLFARQAELLLRAQALVQDCGCRAGCPSCVGPVLDDAVPLDEGPRQLALRVLRALQSA